MGRLLAIGDIHGQSQMLHQLLLNIRLNCDDQLVFLGDYIDRGPDSRGVIDQMLSLREKFPQTVFLRGNHDQMLLDALIEVKIIEGDRLRDLSPAFVASADPSDLSVFMRHGGETTLASYGVKTIDAGLPVQHIDFLRQTQFWWKQSSFIFAHAGLEPSLPVEQQDPYCLLWARRCAPGKDGEIHVVGHQPTTNSSPLFEHGRYSLDTGAAYGHALTACSVFTKQFWQVD